MSIMLILSLQLLKYLAMGCSIVLLHDIVAIGLKVNEPMLMHNYTSACIGFFISWALMLLFYILVKVMLEVERHDAFFARQLLDRDRL